MLSWTHKSIIAGLAYQDTKAEALSSLVLIARRRRNGDLSLGDIEHVTRQYTKLVSYTFQLPMSVNWDDPNVHRHRNRFTTLNICNWKKKRLEVARKKKGVGLGVIRAANDVSPCNPCSPFSTNLHCGRRQELRKFRITSLDSRASHSSIVPSITFPHPPKFFIALPRSSGWNTLLQRPLMGAMWAS